jgi:hypothetical protein
VTVIAILFMALLSIVGTTLLMISLTENTIASNELWSEGAFHAAEAGLNVAIDQLGVDQTASTAAIPVTTILQTTNGPYTYRSGRRTDAGPTGQAFVTRRLETGYSIGLGTQYNSQGYDFYVYRVNATGTGPRSAVREIEAQAEYGPVPR